MKKYFMVSLCVDGGIIGGGLVANDEQLIYRTNKLTVAKKYRNLEINYQNIESYSSKWFLFFPLVNLEMKNKEIYKFIIFNKKRLIKILEEKNINKSL